LLRLQSADGGSAVALRGNSRIALQRGDGLGGWPELSYNC